MIFPKRIASILAVLLLGALLCAPASAQAAFGIADLDVTATNRNGTVDLQAGSHPYAFTVDFTMNQDNQGKPEGTIRDLIVDLPPGLIGNPEAVPRCSGQDFVGAAFGCPQSSQIGIVVARVRGIGTAQFPLYNLTPPLGVPASIGFHFFENLVVQHASLRGEGDYGVSVSSITLPTSFEIQSVTAIVWGVPADPGHDTQRGDCFQFETGSCPSEAPLEPFLSLPTSCDAPLKTTLFVDSVEAPGDFFTRQGYESKSALSLNESGEQAALNGCEAVPFAPQVAAQPSSRLAESASGLDFELRLPGAEHETPEGIAETQPKKVRVTLPEGMTVNPSAAEGIGICPSSGYKAETIDSKPGEGCPEASKLGSILARTPLLDEPIEGALYLAKPFDDPSNSLIGLYIVARARDRGILVKLAGKVEPDSRTGQLVTTFEGLPPLPYSDFNLHFREGARGPLVTPPTCGTFETTAELTPFSAPGQPRTVRAPFQVQAGVDGGACPAGGAPFNPGFEAGTNNNNAASFSPFYMRLTRRDGDQDLTRFAAELPPGMVAKLAGTDLCPDSAIAIAKAKTGLAEQASPSCPASSQIGRVLAGAGVGSVLTRVPGKVYLAGPYNGAPLSVIGIVPAVAGPFDVGTVVSRQALRIDPRTAEVRVDDAASDPIPHILAGIPLRVRDIRVYIDKPEFTLNPTSCDPFAVGASLWGGGADVFSSLDDSPISLADRFQAANCANLGFKPRLSLKLKGGTGRGAHPALTGIFRPRPGDANLKNLVLRLPRSAFLDQAHIRTICTRVQFAAVSCPQGAVYGKARAFSPLISEPLTGPVILRSSSHNLPDFVADLHGIIDVEAVARIDSKRGGIRATFNETPDAPISKVIVEMQGGKKGLIVNSRGLCGAPSRANAQFSGHNGRRYEATPVVRADCGRKGKRRR